MYLTNHSLYYDIDYLDDSWQNKIVSNLPFFFSSHTSNFRPLKHKKAAEAAGGFGEAGGVVVTAREKWKTTVPPGIKCPTLEKHKE